MNFQNGAANQSFPKLLLPYDRSSETLFLVILLKFCDIFFILSVLTSHFLKSHRYCVELLVKTQVPHWLEI